MENYNENMNYSFEPMPEQSAHTQAHQEPEKPKKQKKSHTTLKLVALMLVVAIVAGAGGSVLTNVINNLSDKNAAQQEEDAEPAMAESELPEGEQDMGSYTLVSSPLPEKLPSNSGDKSLSRSEVYAMNVNACVGIATQITTNIWGQTASASVAGSGFILTEDGYVVTNNHVVEDATSVTVKLYDGQEYEAQIIGTDSMNDVALLKIEASGLQAVAVGNSDELSVGEEVIAIGNPLGELTFTMTAGCISALDREINTDGKPINMMQTDAAINSGNSGGPLFDMNGNVIGITTAKYSGSTSSGTSIEGIGFAIPINDVMDIVYDLQQYGYVKDRAYLGVTVRDLNDSTAQTYGLPVGPMVQSVSEGSCTEKAGVQQGDIIIGYEGKTIESYTDLVAALHHSKAGDTVTLTVFRAGAQLDLTVTLDERPQDTEISAIEDEQNQKIQQEKENQQQQQQQINPFDPFGFGN